MLEDLILSCPETDFKLSEDDSGKKLFRKQLIYEGRFTDGQGNTFDVTQADLQHWHKTHLELSANGIEVPVPVGHTEDAEKRRGTLVQLELDKDTQNRNSLYGVFDFGEDDAPVKRKNQVSIYVPPTFKDGKGNTYSRPIKHVALTDYPVVPGLEGFETAIVASLQTKKKPKGKTMENLIELLNDELGMQIDPAASEAAVFASIRAAVKNAQMQDPPKDGEEPPAPGEGEGEGEGDEEKPKPVAASLVGLVKDSRETKINNLVSAGKITPAVATKLKEQHTSDDAIALSFSNEGQYSEDAAFNSMIAALNENDPVISFESKTKNQAGEGSSATSNVLTKDAESRA